MDINATMRQLFDAEKIGAVGKAQELALAILTWINHGGFAPHGFTIGQAKRAAQMILTAPGVAARVDGDLWTLNPLNGKEKKT